MLSVMTGARPVLGIMGGGQLGRMLAMAAQRFDVDVRVLDPNPDACAGAVAPLTAREWRDTEAIRRWASACDVVTYEFENIPEDAARAAMAQSPLRPGIEALLTAQDRARERGLFDRVGIPTPKWDVAEDADELRMLAASRDLPAIVKSRRGGYDGKGQVGITTPDDASDVYQRLGGRPVILDERIGFTRELSVVAARGVDGSIACYPIAENVHRHGILVWMRAPAAMEDERGRRLREAAASVLHALEYVGVVAIEFFDDGERLLANEVAPRVHNTGHWTLDAALTSQFEQHVRAVLGLPLGGTDAICEAAMVNLIGALPDRSTLAGIEGGRVHLYGKTPMPGRKLGHVTLLGGRATAAAAEEIAQTNVHG